MIKSSYHLFTVFGIPIKADLSLLILAFILVQNYGDPFLGIAFGFFLLLSVLFHELGHSLVAIAFGCRVKDITLMMIGGCASMLSMPRKAWQEFLMAFAGPAVSMGLAIVGFLVSDTHIDKHLNIFCKTGVFYEFAFHVAKLNTLLFVFNLLPAFPMDGGRILRAFLQQFFMTKVKATWIASRIGRFIAILMALSVVFSIIVLRDFETFMIIRLLIAYSIYRAAEQEYQMVLAEEGYGNGNPFARFGFPFFGRTTRTPPPDDGQAIVSPPPYERGGGKRVDVRKE